MVMTLCPPSPASAGQEWIQNKRQSETLAREDSVPMVQGKRHFPQTQRNTRADTRQRWKALEPKFLPPKAHCDS